MRPNCEKCRYSWTFTARVRAVNLKRSYWVKCPKCGNPMFRRIKRYLKKPSTDPTPPLVETTISKEEKLND